MTKKMTMNDDKKLEIAIDKDRDAEDWCFKCKEGGELIICDYEDCLKVYHSYCVKSDQNSETDDDWFCDRHNCSSCRKTPKFVCLGCPVSVCEKCISRSGFVPVQVSSGLCEECLDLVLLGEEDEACDSDGVVVNFKDIDTCEGLFKSYWEIIKKQEGLTDSDIHDAVVRLRRQKSNKPCSVSRKPKKIHKDDDFCVNESDEDEPKVRLKVLGKEKISKKLEFEGWASKPLTEFLKSINRYSSESLSQFDVELIIKDYIREKNLTDPTRKYKVCCDERLRLLFERKSMRKVQIDELLELHLVETVVESSDDDEDDEDDDDSDNHNDRNSNDEVLIRKKANNSISATKRQRSLSSDDDEEPAKKAVKDSIFATRKRRSPSSDDRGEDKKVGNLFRPSCFASVIPDNIRRVYLRKTLLEEYLKIPEDHKAKIVGSFVRVKTDSRNCSRRNTHQLLPVTGIEISSTDEIFLKVSSMEEHVCLSKVSDSDFTEDECKELQENITNGLLKKLTVVDLQEKVNILHLDVTKDWIKRELLRLESRIDFANEKGRRRELHELVEQQERLEKPAEQEKLLQSLPPDVIPDVEEIKDGSDTEARSSDEKEREREKVNDFTEKQGSSSSVNDEEPVRNEVKDYMTITEKHNSSNSVNDEEPVRNEVKDSTTVTDNIRPSCFASVIPDNIRCVYLRKTLLEEFLKIPENHKAKVVGSFVRVKTDSRNSSRRNTYQLLPVTGIEISSTDEIFLKVSSMEEHVCLSTVSDSDFTEEECKELQEKIANGLLKKLSVVDLQEKVNILHLDVTKDWIKRELEELEARIDFANDKGRRRNLHELIERQERLEKPAEQEKLLQSLPPNVIPNVEEIKDGSDTEARSIDEKELERKEDNDSVSTVTEKRRSLSSSDDEERSRKQVKKPRSSSFVDDKEQVRKEVKYSTTVTEKQRPSSSVDDEERVRKEVKDSTSVAEKHISSNSVDDEGCAGKKVKDFGLATNKHGSPSTGDQSEEKKVGIFYKPSGFASVICENIRRVYLRKSLLEEFFKNPEDYETKIIGSFIRVKTDSRKGLLRNPHRLLPVTGIQISSTSEILLKVSSMEERVCLSRVSDSDFTEDECKELQENVANGLLKKLTVVDAQEKMNILHCDITKDWIKRELALLEGRIEFANEKGRRRQLHDLVERQEQLEKPSEQEKLLHTLPKVIVEEIKDGSDTEMVRN